MTRARFAIPFRLDEIGLVLFHANLIDAFDGAPKTPEIVHLVSIARHADHLDHDLQFRPALMLHAGKAHVIFANLFEASAFAIVFKRLLRSAIEAQGNVSKWSIEQSRGGFFVEKRSVGRE